MSRRIPTIAGVLVLLAPLGLLFETGGRGAVQSRSAAEAESFEVLAAAHTPADMREAVGPLGVVFEIRGGDWVAVRYRDSHAAPSWSSAVARDSRGGWFVSREHFCGRFHAHRLRRAQGDAGEPELSVVERAESLDAARAGLLALGFQPAPPRE